MSLRTELLLLLLAGLGACAALFVRIDTGANWFFWGPFFDAGHYPFFFIVSIFTIRFWKKIPFSLPLFLRTPYLLLAFVVVAVELIQPYFRRSASLVDVQNGLLGVAAAGLVYHSMLWAKNNFQRMLILGSAAALVLPLLWPTRGSLQAIRWRNQHFPQLAHFAEYPESVLWGPLEPRDATLKRYSSTQFVRAPWLSKGGGLLVRTKPGHYAGVGYSAGDFDWSTFSYLVVRVVNPSTEVFTLLLRIDDPHPDTEEFSGRFNTQLELQPGQNEFRIAIQEIEAGPENRSLDTSRIRALFLFTDIEDSKRKFILDELLLVK